MHTVNDIREHFLKFFEDRDHTRVPSSSLVPTNDPTLLFTNAGMVQFKNVFTGQEKRPYKRAASAQKCVRAGGKHNDLENVGYTARHHTFFEMLGNFSFGDYFKEEAIAYAWELITRDFGVKPDRLWATVYHEDDEAYRLWKKISSLPESRIVKISTADNFWAMGETGPCGPCTEIFYDHGKALKGDPPGKSENQGDRFVEIWNLVFMQYEQVDEKTRIDLPKASVDTGMGLERIAAALQGTFDNYKIDTFRALIEACAEETGAAPDGKQAASHRVIADHIRATAFLIADGVLPTNEGRGYVLRRIMRRAMRHAHILEAKDLLLYKLAPVLTREMGQAYPELSRAEPLVTETLKLEEGRFREMLARGLKLLAKETKKLKKGGRLPGAVAFKLYDTYGFPLDLTQDALKAEGITVDTKGFDKAMAEQRRQARAAWKGSGEAKTKEVWFDLKDELGGTDFLGYKQIEADGKITALVKGAKRVQQAKTGNEIEFLANQTPFYAEAGGQVGDTGLAETKTAKIRITDTQKELETLFVHKGRVEKGTVREGETVHLTVDAKRREKLRANHSATHLLHQALRRRLGPHVTQKGSLVAEGYLRFDISHPKRITAEELDQVEADVNEMIRNNSEVATRLMAPDEALREGALAMFGEKYGDEVRVVSMGEDAKGPYSVEFCGGTHVRRTGDIALFKIINESSVSAGVRRIEALTGEAARQYLLTVEQALREAASVLKTSPSEVPQRVKALLEERKTLEQKLTQKAKADTAAKGEHKSINGLKVFSELFRDVHPNELRGIADEAKKKLGSGVVVLVSNNEGKGAVLVGVTGDLAGKIDAVELVKEGAKALGGSGGGGRPDLAQAGGPEGKNAKQALIAIEKRLEELSV